MQAIILAGGFGTRLRQVIADVPKPMALIAGRPFLELLLGSLATKGITKVVLSIGFMGEKISTFFGDSFAGMELAYAIEDEPLGTGGGVRLAINQITEDHVYVFNGDTFLDIELALVERQWLDHKRPIIISCEVPDTCRYGRLIASGGVVTGFTEKGVKGSGLINAGCYVLERTQLDKFLLKTHFSLESEFLGPAVMRGEFDMFVTHGIFIDIGIPEDYARAQAELSSRACKIHFSEFQ
jgi:D-glycero-alpha-D-manno-heptose 1-phosphate guanylyltransferase